MNNNHDTSAVQAHLDQFFSQLAQSPDLEGQLRPQDLPQLLQAGLAHVLKGALKRERDFHLEQHPQDRANGYAPHPKQAATRLTKFKAAPTAHST